MHRIISYAPEYRSALLNLSLRAWEPVFPVVRNEVPGFVYGAFYPCQRRLNFHPVLPFET